jgi:hypothetical protein
MAKKLMTIDDNLMMRIKIAAAKRNCTHQQLIVDAVEKFLGEMHMLQETKTEESYRWPRH